MITVYIKKIANITENEEHNIVSSLSDGARTRLDKKRNGALRLASLCALSLLNDEQRKNIDYNENGSPYFQNLNAEISISHSQTHVAIAVSDSRNTTVGVDIEDITSKPISTRFLTENEKSLAINATEFINIWTKKEALFKFLKNGYTPFIHLDSTTPEIYGAQFSTMQIENSILTICTKRNEKIEIIQK